MTSLAPLSSPAWRAYDAATLRFLATTPGTFEFEAALKTLNAAEVELERADMLASGAVADGEIMLIMCAVGDALRGRVRDDLLRRALEAVECVLMAPAPDVSRATPSAFAPRVARRKSRA